MNAPRLEFLDPASLGDHPENWKFHPATQQANLAELIGELGWLKPLVFNSRTNRLLDGHGRKAAFVDRGELVPVYVVDLAEELERKALATLDPSGWESVADKRKFEDLLTKGDLLARTKGSLNDLLKAVARTGSILDAPTDTEALATTDGQTDSVTIALDSIWPSDNVLQVPSLLPHLQAQQATAPVTTWGTIGHTRAMLGTWHFYTADDKFTPLWKRPDRVLRSGCVALVEPNFSLTDQTPWPEALSRIYRKRWLARYWQANGKRIFVDLNCDSRFNAPHEAAGMLTPNLLGVPRGWSAFASRAHANQPELLLDEWRIAQEWAEDATPLFLVVGGGKRVRQLATEHGWIWVPEQLQQVHGVPA